MFDHNEVHVQYWDSKGAEDSQKNTQNDLMKGKTL